MSPNPLSKPEQRFNENSGERFLGNGKIRCHGLAKSKMRQWREAYNDYETPSDLLWPECQCGNAAEENQFVCKFHGGLTPRVINPPRTILDVMPLNMAEKFRALMDSPDYMSRKEDINLLRTRIMMLIDDMNEYMGSEEAWGHVHEALAKIRQGDLINAELYLKKAIENRNDTEHAWKEVMKAQKLLGEMTMTQVKTAKELQTIATTEQVGAMISTLLNLINAGAKTYIPDPTQRSQFSRTIIDALNDYMDLSPKKIIDAEISHT